MIYKRFNESRRISARRFRESYSDAEIKKAGEEFAQIWLDHLAGKYFYADKMTNGLKIAAICQEVYLADEVRERVEEYISDTVDSVVYGIARDPSLRKRCAEIKELDDNMSYEEHWTFCNSFLDYLCNERERLEKIEDVKATPERIAEAKRYGEAIADDFINEESEDIDEILDRFADADPYEAAGPVFMLLDDTDAMFFENGNFSVIELFYMFPSLKERTAFVKGLCDRLKASKKGFKESKVRSFRLKRTF